jgi:hypothetical protein
LLVFIGSPVPDGCYFFFRLMSQSISEWMFRPRLAIFAQPLEKV